MKRIISIGILILCLSIGMSVQLSAERNLDPKQVQRLDRKMTKKHTRQKRFRTQKEYQRLKQRARTSQRRTSADRRVNRRMDTVQRKSFQRRYSGEERYDRWDYPRGPRQQGYRHFKRGWYLAYRYDRASFYDRYGYHYGYFNRYGFEFDGIFYGYDRYYRYQDRMRGRGLFDNRYYMPADAGRYGFCAPRPPRPYPRPWRRP